MRLDRCVALLFLVVSIVYGLAAYHFPILPFERNMAFLPNTLPKVLSIAGALLSLFILLSPSDSMESTDIDFRKFRLGQASGLILGMVCYAVLLRPVGFITATILFILGSSMVLGERKLYRLLLIAFIAAFSIWYLVQETLGIYLSPWPRFLS
ncbi:MAG: tripartite tricarboxylate transporter TctB family protein [Gammaproteobacteria bacterium]|nr:tripartite tricarboxylate transporter TctB family protein [Gammaproteobacteria bacterium]